MLKWICSEQWWGIRAEEGIYLLILWMSSSRPTRKRKKMSPRSANVSSTATELWGKMVAVKPGMYPRAVGPNKMPPRISAKLLPCPLMSFVKALPKTTYWQATLPWLSIDSPHHFNKRFLKISWFCATLNSSLRQLFQITTSPKWARQKSVMSPALHISNSVTTPPPRHSANDSVL